MVGIRHGDDISSDGEPPLEEVPLPARARGAFAVLGAPICATFVVLMGAGSCAGAADDRWNETTAHVESLRASIDGDVCIVMAYVEADARRDHVSGTCTTRSLFQIGSITKTFTGVLLADAVLDGRVELDTTIESLLEGVRPKSKGRPITLLDLATHTSGLPRLPDNVKLDAASLRDPYATYGRAELRAFLSSHEPRRAPEDQVEYSNLGMGLLGFLLSDLGGSSYGELVSETVTVPLGMADTVVEPSPEQLARATPGHERSGAEVPRWKFDALAGAGALYSTLDDMVLYLRANLIAPAGPVGDRLALASRIHRPAPAFSGSVGLAWIHTERAGRRITSHNGGTAGHRSFVGFVAEEKRGVVVLASAALDEVDAIGAYLLGKGDRLPAIATTDADGPGSDYLGTFRFTPSFAITVTSDGTKLFAQATGQPRFALTQLREGRYAVSGVEAEIQFDRNDAGAVESLTLLQNGIEQRARKDGVVPDRPVVEIAPALLDRYVGRYELAPGAIMTVTRDGAALMIQLTGQPAFPVYPKSTTRFYYEVVQAEVEFNAKADGEITSLTLFQNGRHDARRLPD